MNPPHGPVYLRTLQRDAGGTLRLQIIASQGLLRRVTRPIAGKRQLARADQRPDPNPHALFGAEEGLEVGVQAKDE
jgi:hypothetical protein